MSTRAVCYARFSSDNQHEESITAQLRACRDFAKRNDVTIVREYIDEAKSATTDDRPSFLRMINDITMSLVQVDYVYVQELNRFSRDRYDFALYRYKLKQVGTRIISVTQPIPDGPEGIILEAVIEAMAEHYSKNLSKVVMDRMLVYAEQGIHLGGSPPLGYDVDPKTRKYVINPVEAELVRTIYELAAAGTGYGGIMGKLNKLGAKTKVGKNFGKNSLHDILKNEKYTGAYIFNRTKAKDVRRKRNSHSKKNQEEIIKIENNHPAIIAPEEWEAVQKIMEQRRQIAPRRHNDTIYLLTGKMFCGECGAAYTGFGQIAGRNKTYYQLYRCVNKRQTKTCQNKDIRKEIIESFVLDEIESMLSGVNTPKVVASIQERYERTMEKTAREYEQVKKNLATISSKMDNLFESIESGFLAHSVAGPRLNVLAKEKETLEARIIELESTQQIPLTEEQIEKYLKQNQQILGDRDNLLACKRLVDAYVQKVILYADDIKIIFKVPTSSNPSDASNGGGGGAHLTLEASWKRKSLYKLEVKK